METVLLTQYTNGRTASREDKRPDPSTGGLYDNMPKLGKIPSLPILGDGDLGDIRFYLPEGNRNLDGGGIATTPENP
jgi:hypothetical protein